MPAAKGAKMIVLSVILILLQTLLGAGFNEAVAMSTNEGPVALEPGRVSRGQPAGLFGRVDVTMMGSRRVETKTWLFLPRQRVSRAYPYGGTGTFDPSRCSADTCGDYRIGGGKLSVRWDGGRIDQWAFATTADGISLDGALYRPARALAPAVLAGRWSDSGAGGSNIYTFDTNGRFSFGTSDRALTGTYRVEGLALILTFADGDTRRRTLFAASGGAPIGMISVEGEVYARN
jgi:hypothetical protein